MAGLEADVPEEREEALERRGPAGLLALRQQHHDVHVGAGQQLAAAIAADGDEGDGRRRVAGMQLPGATQQRIDQERAIAHQRLDRLVGGEAPRELGVAVGERGAECGAAPSGSASRAARESRNGQCG